MHSFHSYRLSLLLCFLLLLFSVTNGSSQSGGPSLSPIRHLEASLAASEGQGTVVAMQSRLANGQECMVVVSRSPKRNNGLVDSEATNEDASSSFEQIKDGDAGVRLVALSPLHQSRRWTAIGPLSICFMTGFAADIQHLTRYALNQVESHQTLYSQPMRVDKLVKVLASKMQNVAQVEGSRPYGVQALIVGIAEKGQLCLYTLDPTGAWRNFRGATTVGRFALDARTVLTKRRKEAVEKSLSLRMTLELCIDSLVGAMVKNGFKPDLDKMEGLVVWANERGMCQKAAIHRQDMEDCYQACIEKLGTDRSMG